MPCEGSKTKLTQQLFKIFRLLFIFTKQKSKIAVKMFTRRFPMKMFTFTLFL